MEGGFYLVHLQTARFDDVAIVVPSDVGHHQRVGAAVGWNAHRVVGEARHFSFQVVFVDFLHRFDKRVELAIAECALLVFLAFDFEFHRGGGVQSVRHGERVVHNFHLVDYRVALHDICHDVGQVVLRHNLLFIAQLNDSFGHFLHVFLAQLNAQFQQILGDACLARQFTKGVFTFAAEAFGQQAVVVEFVFPVAVGMYASGLCKHILANDRLVLRHHHTRERLHDVAHGIDLLFVNARGHVQHVVHHRHHRGQRSIASAFAQSVDGAVNALDAHQSSSESVACGKVVVVVGVEVEMQSRVAVHHTLAVFIHLIRIHDAERVGKHKSLNGQVLQRVHQFIHIVLGGAYAIRPVLKIEIHLQPLGVRQVHFPHDVGAVLFERFAQLEVAVPFRSLHQQINHLATHLVHPFHRFTAVDKSQNFDARELAIVGSPLANRLCRLEFTDGNVATANLDARHTQIGEQHTRYAQLLSCREAHTRGLLAITQCGVEKLDMPNSLVRLRPCVKYFTKQ